MGSTRYAGLVEGRGRYAGDLRPPETAHLHFVRSPHAHATILGIDIATARELPGVIGVFTADDLDIVPIWEIHLIPDHFAQPALARDTVCYVGERVVAVVAETLAEALDAAEAVVIDYEPLPAAVTVDDALGAPPIIAPHGSNVALEWHNDAGERHTVDGEIVVRGVIEMPRVAASPLEGLAVLAVPDGGTVTLHASTQSPGNTRIQTARSLGVDLEQVRVLVPRVGGAFGGKSLGGIGEYIVAAAIARRVRRPVSYHEDRGTNLATMHGRGIRLEYELRVDAAGMITSIALDELCDAGAYPQTNAVEPGKTLMMMCGPYRVPAVRFRGRSVVTNLPPNGAYRGPGRSECTAVLERALDRAAAGLGLDPVEIRRRNLLTAAELPCVTIAGAHYDRVDHHAVLDRLLSMSRYEKLRTEQRRRRGDPNAVQLGIGLATVVDSTAWFARIETARIRLERDGVVRVHVGTASAGQEHGAALASIVHEVLTVPRDDIDINEGDTDQVVGTGTSGSRSLQLAGSAVKYAAEQLLVSMTHIAAELLEAARADIAVDEGRFFVRGSPTRAVGHVEIAAKASPLDATCTFDQDTPTYPAAAHLSVVEVDPETGRVQVLEHFAVTDCGVVIDPVGANGQVVGASAQGIGQVLYEQVQHDAAGTPMNTSLAEYLLPSAAEQPPFRTDFVATPAEANPLGAKGIGEIGMVAAPSAVWNAVVDAIAHLGVEHIEVPCSPERVWRAINGY